MRQGFLGRNQNERRKCMEITKNSYIIGQAHTLKPGGEGEIAISLHQWGEMADSALVILSLLGTILAGTVSFLVRQHNLIDSVHKSQQCVENFGEKIEAALKKIETDIISLRITDAGQKEQLGLLLTQLDSFKEELDKIENKLDALSRQGFVNDQKIIDVQKTIALHHQKITDIMNILKKFHNSYPEVFQGRVDIFTKESDKDFFD